MMKFHVAPLFPRCSRVRRRIVPVFDRRPSTTGSTSTFIHAAWATESDPPMEHRSGASLTPDFALGGSHQLDNLPLGFSSTSPAISEDVCAKGEVCCKYEQDRSASCMSRHECLDTYKGKIVNQEQCK